MKQNFICKTVPLATGFMDYSAYIPSWAQHSTTFYVIIIDLEGKYAYVNSYFEKRFFFLSPLFIGRYSLESIHPDDHEKCQKVVAQCLANPCLPVKVQLRKPSEQPQDFFLTDWEFSVLQNETQQSIGIFCVGYDATLVSKANQQAQLFGQKVDTILGEISEGFFQLDPQWRFVKINRVAETILLKPKQELLGKVFWDFFPEDPAYQYPTHFRKATQEGVTVVFEEYRHDLQGWFNTVVHPSGEGLSVFFRDITQEHNNRQALENSEYKLQAILDSTSDSNIMISQDYKILSFNRAAASGAIEIFGKPLQHNTSVWDFVLEEDKEEFLYDTNLAFQGESLIFDKQIKGIWFEFRYFPVYDNTRQIFAISLNATPIQERKQAEEKILEKEHMLRAIYHSTTEASTFLDTQLIIRYSNQIAKDITKQLFGREAQIGEPILEYILPEFQAEFSKYYEEALQGKRNIVEKTDGQDWWQFIIHPVYDEKQEIIGIAHNVQNITARKLQEIQLQESEQVLQKTIEAIPHVFLILDENTNIQYTNYEFEKTFGYTLSEVYGKNIVFLIPERFREKHNAHYKSYLQNGGKSTRMGRFLAAKTKSGQEIVIEASLNTFTVNEKKFIIVILQDVTAIKKNQDTILKQNEALRNIAWQQSHEVRKPLANILGLCDLLENYTEGKQEDQKLYIRLMLQAAKELDKLIRQIVQKSNDSEYYQDDWEATT